MKTGVLCAATDGSRIEKCSATAIQACAKAAFALGKMDVLPLRRKKISVDYFKTICPGEQQEIYD